LNIVFAKESEVIPLSLLSEVFSPKPLSQLHLQAGKLIVSASCDVMGLVRQPEA
jgi:hypothetical protein